MRSRSAAIWLRLILIVAGLGVAAFIYAFPLYWLVATSLKGKAELYQSITLIPQHPTLASYGSVLFERGFWVLLKNSVIVCAATVVVTLAVGLLITYPITRLPVPPQLRVGVLNWALSLRFLPPIAVVIPYFTIVRTIGLTVEAAVARRRTSTSSASAITGSSTPGRSASRARPRIPSS